ncbi:hypothetical protein ACLI4Y_14945 [Natrialbaceae archaeon A-CW3]
MFSTILAVGLASYYHLTCWSESPSGLEGLFGSILPVLTTEIPDFGPLTLRNVIEPYKNPVSCPGGKSDWQDTWFGTNILISGDASFNELTAGIDQITFWNESNRYETSVKMSTDNRPIMVIMVSKASQLAANAG